MRPTEILSAELRVIRSVLDCRVQVRRVAETSRGRPGGLAFERDPPEPDTSARMRRLADDLVRRHGVPPPSARLVSIAGTSFPFPCP